MPDLIMSRHVLTDRLASALEPAAANDPLPLPLHSLPAVLPSVPLLLLHVQHYVEDLQQFAQMTCAICKAVFGCLFFRGHARLSCYLWEAARDAASSILGNAARSI